MIVALDVHYEVASVRAGWVGFEHFVDASSSIEGARVFAESPEPYTPGAFFRRELRYLEAAIEGLAERPSLAVIDGYVWLGAGRPGLGALLYERLGGSMPIVGVAKNVFRGNSEAIEVRRGSSTAPLFVTAIGFDTHEAAAHVLEMAGVHRLPTLLKRADHLARGRD